jgi:hypothetical protein
MVKSAIACNVQPHRIIKRAYGSTDTLSCVIRQDLEMQKVEYGTKDPHLFGKPSRFAITTWVILVTQSKGEHFIELLVVPQRVCSLRFTVVYYLRGQDPMMKAKVMQHLRRDGADSFLDLLVQTWQGTNSSPRYASAVQDRFTVADAHEKHRRSSVTVKSLSSSAPECALSCASAQ